MISMMCVSGLLLLIPHAPPVAGQTVPTEYAVGPGDVLTVIVFGEPELSGSYTVDSDGSFDFPLLGRVEGGDLTLLEIAQTLTTLLADGYLRRPQVTVDVEQFRSQGEVRSPGKYAHTGNMALLEALAQAGSTTASAGSELLIIHAPSDQAEPGPVLLGDDPDEEGRDITRVNLAALQTGQLSENITLRDGDTIFVPRAETFFVTGHVVSPGSYVLEPGMTVLQALSLAGGVTDRGSTRRMKVIRILNGEKQELSVNLSDVVRPGDTIVVAQRFF